MMKRFASFLLVIFFLLSAQAQDLRIPVPEETRADRASVRALLRDSRKLARKGKALHAHFLHAYRLHPEAPKILEQLLLTAATDADRRFWAHRLAAVRTSGNGNSEDPHPGRIATARVRAVQDLAALVKDLDENRPTSPLVARWAAGAALEVLENAPALRARFGPVFNVHLEPRLPAFRPVVKRLAVLQAKAEAKGDLGSAIRIAACLNGLETQARFKQLQGPRPPGAGKGRNRAAEALQKLRAQRWKAEKDLPDLSELLQLAQAPHRAFNRRHASIGNPAACLSPGKRYRIETTCGLETLVAAAQTVEQHHGRLAGWFGQDPFKDRPGLIRIVPAPADLESEAALSWWASGFQRGDETVIRFAWNTSDALGRAITRQLTRRFDAAIHPGIPVWLAEGRATWTEQAYASTEDAKFRTKHAVFGRMNDAYLNGYGSAAKLKFLIEDRIEDSGFAGYALYVYLSIDRFAGCLEAFMKDCVKNRGNRFKLFLRHFGDGKDDRPGDFEAFAGGFHEFINDFNRFKPAAWTEEYRGKSPHREYRLITDVATWIPGRARTEPWFGEAHARTAGDLLLEAGEHDLGIAGWCWALAVDEWDPALVDRLAELFHAQWYRAGAWALRCEAHRRFPRVVPGPGTAPFWPRLEGVKALLKAYRDAVWHYYRLGDAITAAHVAREHNRLAARVARPRISLPDSEDLPVFPASPAHHVGARGWVETGLTDFEKRRVQGLWFADAGGDLILGRKRSRSGTGTADSHSFVRSREWLPRGRYVIRAQIHPESARFSGALVLGYTRRDRNIRVYLGNDPGSVGKTGTDVPVTYITGVDCRIDGRFVRDRNLPGSSPRRTRVFNPPRCAFRLEAVVDGDQVHVFIDGRPMCSYRTPGGSPVEGYVGFASRRGSFRVQFPTVERLDGIPLDRLGRPWPRGLDPAERQELELSDLLNRPTRGLPLRAAGTVVLWIPPVESASTGNDDKEAEATETFLEEKGLALAMNLGGHLRKYGYREPIVLAVPDRIGSEAGKKLRKALDSRGAAGVKIVAHEWPGGLKSQVLFIGPDGTLRTAEAYPLESEDLPVLVRQWALVCARLAGS